jgi:glutathione synthase/RimK-type ligase-like ATP-grasp enzyme
MNNCAILTMENLSDFECYDSLLDKPLAKLGWQTQLVSWRKKNVDWQQFDAVIIRSPWDYQDDANAFISVLEDIERSSAVLQNSLATVRWNIDKIYLKSLAEQQVNIVPTLWSSNFSVKDIITFFDYFSCQQIVIKPRVSANADNTFWLKKETYEIFLSQLEAIFSQSDFMVQPFMSSVIEEGEFSLFYFSGKYSHAILKTPKTDDFRVQEEHGGKLESITPEKALLAQAESTLAAITLLTGEIPLYARIDFVRDTNSNEAFALMEAELIEPSLYFNMDANSAENFANAFVKRIKKSG